MPLAIALGVDPVINIISSTKMGFGDDEFDWAIATRVAPALDVVILPPAGIYPLNPAAIKRADIDDGTGYTEFSFVGKMAIDATKKLISENR